MAEHKVCVNGRCWVRGAAVTNLERRTCSQCGSLLRTIVESRPL